MTTPFVPLTAPRGAAGAPLLFAFAGNDLVLAGAELPAPELLGVDLGAALCIGEWSGRTCYVLALGDAEPAPALRRIGLRAAHAEIGADLFAIAGRAAQILAWDETHRFCGRCATPTDAAAGERARRCPACGLSVYPRISPAIMVLVLRGRELLLARAPRFAPGMYSALAGFVEAGETLEETVVREVREEVGVEIDGLQYFGSQSWPFPNSLMVAFTARHAGGKLAPDGVEIEAAGWFDVGALPKLPQGISIAHRLITTVAATLRG